jgi:methyltransferase (TIGR00027 family)
LEDDAEDPPEKRLRAFMVARSRYAEDQLSSAEAGGTRQYILLGAGLDTFAYRNPYPGLRVFELDHPATQAWKRERLAAAGIGVPASLRFAAVNFDRESWEDALRAEGFAASEPAFFAWLGVTPYLTEDIVFSTLRLIHSLCQSNGVVFDYALPRVTLNADEQAAHDVIAARVAAAGEPFRGYFEPKRLKQQLWGMGYTQIEDLTGADIDSRFFAGRSDGLGLGGRIAHLLCAVG